jgi:nicotinamidase-related amidase
MRQPTLLVIDLQRGAFDGELCPPIDRADTLIRHASALVDAARDGGAPVVFIQHCDDTPGELFEQGKPQWELHEALVPWHGDAVLKKHASSAFEGTGLADTLGDPATRELVLCGLQSEFCISNTARSALERGYTVVIAQDGHSTWPSKTESAAAICEQVNRELAANGAQLRSTADLARALSEVRDPVLR